MPELRTLMLNEPPGSHDICSICFWEDDNIQLRWPDYAGGANALSLVESQRNYGQVSAADARLAGIARGTAADEAGRRWLATH